MTPIYHYYHCATINHWDELLKEHLSNLILSGLYDEMQEMYVGCVGHDLAALSKIIQPFPKITVVAHSPDLTEYEFLTLRLLKHKCDSLPKTAYIYYSHTKGCSYGKDHPAHIGGKTWGDLMDYFNCTKYKYAIKVLDFGYDIYGSKIIRKRGSPSKRTHISGNSWWANSDYIKSLPDSSTWNIKDRYEAEMIVGEHGALIFTPCQYFIDYKCTETFDELMDSGKIKTLFP